MYFSRIRINKIANWGSRQGKLGHRRRISFLVLTMQMSLKSDTSGILLSAHAECVSMGKAKIDLHQKSNRCDVKTWLTFTDGDAKSQMLAEKMGLILSTLIKSSV
jgi:hypothetical protein